MSPEQALRTLGPAAAGARVVRPLHRAVAKRSYLVARRGERFVLRIDEPPARQLRLDRRSEAQILRSAAQAGVGPELVASRVRAPAIFLLRYVPGRAWTAAELRDRRRLAQLAQLLCRVHAIAAPGPRLDLPGAAVRYAARAREPDARRLAAQVTRRLRGLGDPGAPFTLCHHDPIAGNIVGSRHPQLIDWEYAAAGDPLFDLAAVIQHHDLAPRLARYFLAAYFGSAGAVPWERLVAWRGVYDHILLLWLFAVEPLGPLSRQQRAWRDQARSRLR